MVNKPIILIQILNISITIAYIHLSQSTDYFTLQSPIRNQIQTQIQTYLSTSINPNIKPSTLTVQSTVLKYSDLKTQHYQILFHLLHQNYKQNYIGLFKFQNSKLVEHSIKPQTVAQTRFFVPAILYPPVPIFVNQPITYVQQQSVDPRSFPADIQPPPSEVQQDTKQDNQNRLKGDVIRSLIKKHEIMKDQIEKPVFPKKLMDPIFPIERVYPDQEILENLKKRHMDHNFYEQHKNSPMIIAEIAGSGDQQIGTILDKLKTTDTPFLANQQDKSTYTKPNDNLYSIDQQNQNQQVEQTQKKQTDSFDSGQQIQSSKESLLQKMPAILISDNDDLGSDSFKILKNLQQDGQDIDQQIDNSKNKILDFSDIDRILKSRFRIGQKNPFYPEFDSLPSLELYQDLKKSDNLMYKGSFKTPMKNQIQIDDMIMKNNKNLMHSRTIYDDMFQTSSDKTKYILVKEYKDQTDDNSKKVFQVMLSQVNSEDNIRIDKILEVNDQQVQEIEDYKKQQVQVAQKIDQIVDKITKQAVDKIDNSDGLVFSDFVSLDCIGQKCEIIIKFKDQSKDGKQNVQPNPYIYTFYSQNRYYSVKYQNIPFNPIVKSVTKLDKDDSKTIFFPPVGPM